MNNRSDRRDFYSRQSSDPARVVALDVLEQVREHGTFANLALPRVLRSTRITGRGRAFATNLTYGAIRMRGRWDAIIAKCIDSRAIEDVDPAVLDVLRLGAEQLQGLGTPPHAAIHETVTLARNEVGNSVGGFVNAVLHRISEKTPEEWDEILRQGAGSHSKAMATIHSHPTWIVDEFVTSLERSGRAANALEEVLAANNSPARVALAPRSIAVEDLLDSVDDAGLEADPGKLVSSAVVLQRGNPGTIDAVRSMEAGVQDEGSQLVAHVTAAVPVEGEESSWLDMCAGPGGKTALLARHAEAAGATVFANEYHPHRLDLVADAVENFDHVVLREGDGRDLGELEPGRFDRTLVDAPCTGLGSLRRRPESRWRKFPEDLEELTMLQWELVQSAIAATRVGGVIVYSTCSPVVAETIDIVNRAVEAGGVEIVDALEIARPLVVPGALDTVTGPFIQLWPDEHDSDAMFLAVLRRKDADS